MGTVFYVSLCRFKSLQVLGFGVLLYGTLVFNDVISLPWIKEGGYDESESVAGDDDE